MFNQRFVLVLAAVIALVPFAVECSQSRQPAVPPKDPPDTLPDRPQLINEGARNAIPKQYIVLFKPRTTVREVVEVEKEVDPTGKRILFRYRTGILGFAAKGIEKDVLEKLLANPHVLWVEADQRMSSSSTEPALSRGIDRIDQRLLPLNSTFQFTETGAGVHVYVLDNGIRTTHQEFEGRASSDFSAAAANDGTAGCAGHGTHVAATIGGKTYGVAKKVRLHSVRVMDCHEQGNLSNVIAGVQWITRYKRLPAVANMSISGETVLPSLEVVIQDSITSGVTYVVAAHNRARDACGYSPAHVAEAITVGALNPKSDMRWVLSNDGPCVDLFAPGVAILSAGNTDDKAKAFRAGTSMATAHVAGVAALVLQFHRSAKPADVWNIIHSNNNVSTTPSWKGVSNWQGIIDQQGMVTPSTAWPNEALHWGTLHNGHDDGDPHITTVEGTH